MKRLHKIGKGIIEEKHDLIPLPPEEEGNLTQAQPLIENVERLKKELQEARNDLAAVCGIREDTTAGMLYQRGIRLQEMGSIENAVKSFDKALTLDPPNYLIPSLHSGVDDCIKSLLLAFVKGEGDIPSVPTSWKEWEYNNMFADLQRSLDAWSKIEAVAKAYNRNAVPFLYFGNNSSMVEYVIFMDFPRDGQDAHLGYPDGVPNGYPPNATIRQLIHSLADVLSTYFGIPHQFGRYYIMQKFAFFDVLAIDGPYDQANNTKDNQENYKEYKKIVSDADGPMTEFIDQALTLVPNAKFAVVKSENARTFFKAHPNILPNRRVTLPYNNNSPHPCKLTYGFEYGATENEGYAHVESLGVLFQSYLGLKSEIDVTRGMLDIMFGNKINSKECYNLELWDGEPETKNSRLLARKQTVTALKELVPINKDYCFFRDMKVGEHNKIKHNKMLDKNRKEVHLHVKRVESRKVFESKGVFPLFNTKATGKKGKGSTGGSECIPVALYAESKLSKNAKDEYIINESAFAAQVGSSTHAARILCIEKGGLCNLKPGVAEERTAV